MTEDELDAALAWVEDFLRAYRAEILAMAAGRFAEGVIRYPHGPLYRKAKPELAADVAQELADAAVYAARWLELDRLQPGGRVVPGDPPSEDREPDEPRA